MSSSSKLPGSSSFSIRSRAVSLPLACCFSTASSEAEWIAWSRSSRSWASFSSCVSGTFWRMAGRDSMLAVMPSRIVRVGVVATAASLALAAPAPAYMTDVEDVIDQHLSTSTATQDITLGCPGTKSLLGVGASAFLGAELGLFQVGTIGNQVDGFFVEAAETDPLETNWSLTGHGICVQGTATPPPLGAADSYVKAVRVKRTTGSESSADKDLLAECPGSRVPIAGGGGILTERPNRGVAFEALIPPAQPAAWGARAHETDPTDAAWRLSAAVICANLFTETATSDYVGAGTLFTFEGSSADSRRVKSVSERCPGDLFAVGGGALIRDAAFDFVGDPDVVLTRSEPAKINHGKAKRWVAEATEIDRTDLVWKVEAHVVCVPLDGGPPA